MWEDLYDPRSGLWKVTMSGYYPRRVPGTDGETISGRFAASTCDLQNLHATFGNSTDSNGPADHVQHGSTEAIGQCNEGLDASWSDADRALKVKSSERSTDRSHHVGKKRSDVHGQAVSHCCRLADLSGITSRLCLLSM